jgi:hypothetical protein
MLLCLLPSLTSCSRNVRPAKVETITVQVPMLVPLDPRLLKQEPEPPNPPRACVDAGRPTVCTKALPDYIDALRAWGRGGYEKLRRISGLQPPAVKGLTPP